MNGAVANVLSGDRLHLQHGPIDLVIGADGARQQAFAAAERRFASILGELVAELPVLRSAMPVAPQSAVGKRMAMAARGFDMFTTPMIAVAGAVADEVLAAMRGVDGVLRSYVNNGGDIALFLGAGQVFDIGISGLDARGLGKVRLAAGDGICGVATSGRGGRSFSLGIADSVTVLAKTAAAADAAATLIGNGVDLPDCAKISRAIAADLDPDSDLGDRLVVTGCDALSGAECDAALDGGRLVAEDMVKAGRIAAAFLVLQGQARVVGQKEVANA